MFVKIILLLVAISMTSGSQIAELKCWTERTKTHYVGLQHSANINDSVECTKKCRENDFCRAVDIDRNSVPNCWYQQNDKLVASEADLKPATTVTNYLYDPTCGTATADADLNCWTVTTKSQFPGLRALYSITLNDCLFECISKSYCSVVNWDVDTVKKCWIPKQPTQVSLSNLTEKASATNFILNRDCYNLISSGIDMTFWIVTDLRCYGPENLVQIDKNDLKSCLEYCQNNKDCNMVDFDPSVKPSCWAQTKPFQIKRGSLAESKTCSNYLFLRNQYKNFFEQVYPTLEIRNGTDYKGKGIVALPSVRYLNKCLLQCYKTPNCKSASFEPSFIFPCTNVILNDNLSNNSFYKKAGVTTYIYSAK